MNNDQFRRLVLDQPGKRIATTSTPTPTPNRDAPTPSPSAGILGSRFRSSIPMTPRNVKGVSNADFARQLAEHRLEESQQQRPPPAKRFKSSAAPKGTKLASGYQDRTALRRDAENEKTEEEGEEGVAQRLKALEDMVKLGQIDNATFEKLRKEIGVGGDLGSTHMVKGLDWDLLRRAKAGEEDLSKKKKQEEEEDVEVNVDEELDRMLEQKEDQLPPPKEKKVKKGNLATVPAGRLSRDEILRQLKASRATAATATATPESTLSTKFKKIKDDKPEKKRWVETDANGRRKEVLVITDAEGKTKRKVRWLDKEKESKVDSNGLLLPDQDAKPLGMEVPAVVAAKIAAEAAAAAQAEAEDDDIFAGVGRDYNPLADLDENDSDEEEEEAEEEQKLLENEPREEALQAEPSTAPDTQTKQPARRNYFNEKPTAEDISLGNPLTKDPTLLAALKRAAALRQDSSKDADVEGEEGEFVDEDPEKLARRKKFLEEARRRDAQDALDIDYGFGSSRIEDEEDEEGPTFDAAGQRGGNKRKRGPKKRKGDKDSAADVLRVMEGRKKQ